MRSRADTCADHQQRTLCLRDDKFTQTWEPHQAYILLLATGSSPKFYLGCPKTVLGVTRFALFSTCAVKIFRPDCATAMA